MTWDRVLTINDYYDGPRLGVAEVHGVPHIYELVFDHSADEYSDSYLVSPIDEALLALVLEDWGIWLRWHAVHKRNEAPIETHPALPVDRARYEAIKLAIGDRLHADANVAKRLNAEFRNLRAGGDWTGAEVQWGM
ncbi:hypothetical protein [Andreprevotia chitinilytica]|uniref:hypothetical protein n=1 Tax=Andreprevotia chitinilytica TaxID=396808 RepID=UPI000691A43D|nr:hypothetical protein [Andreprevotia chitinilytica]